MRWSQTFIPTLREPPAGIKHRGLQFLIRGGYLRVINNECSVQLPLLTRVVGKLRHQLTSTLELFGGSPISITNREEQIVTPAAKPETVVGEAERIVNVLVRREIRSYRQLPFSVFHIGLASGEQPPYVPNSPFSGRSEWISIHAFAATPGGLKHDVRLLKGTIASALSTCGLTVTAAAVLSGGEDLIVVSDSPQADRLFFTCQTCGFTAVPEATNGRPTEGPPEELSAGYSRITTPGMKTVEEVTAFLGVPAQKLVKTLLYKTEREVIGVLVRGDRTLNESKLRHVMGVSQLQLLDAEGVYKLTGAMVGFSGPIGLNNIRLVADTEVLSMKNFVVGGNEDDEHLINVNLPDFHIAETADLRDAMDGDSCSNCDSGTLRQGAGFAIGCVSPASGASAAGIFFDDEHGHEVAVWSGAIHFDLSGILTSAAEIHHDERGVCWPPALAPYDIHLLAVNLEDDRQWNAVQTLEDRFADLGLEVLLDDRPLRMGVRFYDADLVGIPFRVVIGPKKLADGLVELGIRATGEVEVIKFDNVAREVARLVKNAKNG